MTNNDYITIAVREETYELFEQVQEERFGTSQMPNTETFDVILEEYQEFQGGADE